MAEGDPAELLARTGRLVEIDCLGDSVAAVTELLARVRGIRRIDPNEVGLTVYMAHGESPDAVTIAALESELVQSVRVRPPDMVEVFESLSRESGG